MFLGYHATMDNIVYWDVHAHQKRTARHYDYDELQYGTAPENRSPASRHLLEVHTGTPHTERRTHELLEKATDVHPTDTPIMDDNTQIIQDSPLPYTAALHRITLPSPDELTQSLQLLDISLNVTEPSVSETVTLAGTHPTLGLITEDHPEYSETVILK